MNHASRSFDSLRSILLCEPLETRINPVSIRFDTSLDPTGFFSDPAKMEALRNAASAVTAQMTDSLAAIRPGSGDTWTPTAVNPFTSGTIALPVLNIGADEIVIFVGGGDLPGDALAMAGGGAYNASGSQSWLDTIRTRGQIGVDSGTDFSTWGGMIGFSRSVRWNFGSGNPAANQYDFTSVATHELMHIFGFGIGNPSYNRYASSGIFTGPNVVATAGTVALSSDIPGETPDHIAPLGTPGGVWSVLNPSIMTGQKKVMTALEYAALRDIGWGTNVTSTAPRSPSYGPVGSSGLNSSTKSAAFAVGTGGGVAGGVQAFGTGGQTLFAAAVFNPFAGGVRVATGDVTGDGAVDYVVGAGPGGDPLVQVIDGRSGHIVRSFYAYSTAFRGGVYVAVGDVTGDGVAEIVTGAGAGGGPHVRVFDARGGGEIVGYFGINDPDFRGGVRVAVGDIDADGYADIVAAAGEGGGPRISVWSGLVITRDRVAMNLTPDFFAYEVTLTNGAYVAVGDLDGDGYRDIITGAGEGGGPRVSAFSGRELRLGRVARIADFMLGDAMSASGVRVASADLNGDGRDDLITGAGPGGDSTVRVFDGRSPGVAPFRTYTNPGWIGGAYVG